MAPGLDITTSSVTDTMKDEFLHLENTTPAKLAAKKASLRTKNSTAEEDIFSSSPTTTTTTTTTPPPQNNITSSKLLQASPYTDRAHHLDLNTLTPPLQLFAQALTAMRSITPSYAMAPYPSAFNWDSIVDLFSQAMQKEGSISNSALPEEELSFYVIVFRSRVNATADRRLLGQLDKAAHLEAVDSGGLLKYWFGTPDADGRNLATCLWRDRSDARRGGAGPGHAQAMRAARSMYDEWFVERLRLSVDVRAGTWRFVPWVDDG